MLENCSDTCVIVLVFLKLILNNLYLIQYILKILIIIKMIVTYKVCKNKGKVRVMSLFKIVLTLLHRVLNTKKYIRLPIRFVLYDMYRIILFFNYDILIIKFL